MSKMVGNRVALDFHGFTRDFYVTNPRIVGKIIDFSERGVRTFGRERPAVLIPLDRPIILNREDTGELVMLSLQIASQRYPGVRLNELLSGMRVAANFRHVVEPQEGSVHSFHDIVASEPTASGWIRLENVDPHAPEAWPRKPTPK